MARGYILCLAVVFFICSQKLSQAQSYDTDFDEKPWNEQLTQLPPFPQVKNLLRIQMETMDKFEVSIDFTSVNIGLDGVVRYVFIAKSSQGSENISFEGIRCETKERKLYAFGRTDKSWGQVRNTVWTSYGSNPRDYHAELAREYFCPDSKNVMNVTEALKNLKQGGMRAKNQGGFAN